MIYALDTNVIIHMFRSSQALRDKRDAKIALGNMLIIPPIVHYEMRRGFLYKTAPAKEKMYSEFCSLFSVGEMNYETWEHAASLYADLRRSGRTVDDADILIAAFCIVGDYTLVTHNTRHFNGISGLKLEDWIE